MEESDLKCGWPQRAISLYNMMMIMIVKIKPVLSKQRLERLRELFKVRVKHTIGIDKKMGYECSLY
jgi:uncharacterized membrane protein YoaT (DUF817 family)